MQTEETEIADESVDLQIMPRADAAAIFEGYLATAAQLIATGEKLEITDAESFLRVAPIARATRLGLRPLRTEMEKKRVELTQYHLKEKQRIDGLAKDAITKCAEIEGKLKKLETWDDDRREADLQRVTAERREQLLAVGGMIPEHVGSIPQEQFEATLQDAKDLKAIREKRAADEEAARVRQEQERQAEIERQRVENERLKAEAAAKDEELRKEREERAAAEQRQRDAEHKARMEREELERNHRLEQQAAEQKAAEERRIAAEEQRRQIDLQQKEQAAREREAEEQRKRELKEQQDRMRVESEKAVKDAEERAGRQRQAEADAEADRQAREQADERKRRANLSDGQKLADYLKAVTALEYPRLAPQRQVQFMALRETLMRGLEDMAKKLS